MSCPFICSRCGQQLGLEAYISRSEIYCKEHQLAGSMVVDENELHLIYHLISCQSYRDLVAVELPMDFKFKIARLFECLE